MNILVIGARMYDFVDDNGRPVKGVSVFHLVNGTYEKNETGQVPQKVNLPIDAWNDISRMSFPVNCELLTEQQLGSKGVYTKVVGLKVVK